MKKILKLFPFIILPIIFFLPLFYPNLKLIYTPDFGRSDIWNFNYPIKNFLSQSLKKGQLPFWSKNIATGFPLLAEGQIGALNIINLSLFSLFPASIAWNLNYFLIFIFSMSGMYFFLKKNQLSYFPSLFGAFVFSFSAFFICHIPHFNLIQTASFLPWIFLTTKNFLDNSNKKNFFLLSILLSQQIFSGHPQITFITIIAVVFFVFFLKTAVKDKIPNKRILFLFIAFLFSLALSSPQILPTLKLTQISSRRTGLNTETIFSFPYSLKYLITFILPNFFGTPAKGTFHQLNYSKGIYWENIVYLGILPIILSTFLVFKKKKQFLEKFSFLLLVISIIFALGRNSPLYFIFTLPVFNYFRVSARYLILAVFSLAILSSCYLQQLKNILSKKNSSKTIPNIILICLLCLSIIDLFSFSSSYNHPLVEQKKALAVPKSRKIIKQGKRIYNYTDDPQFQAWNKVFYDTGWQNINPFLYFKNALLPNLNLLYNITNIQSYAAFSPARQKYYQENLNRKLIDAAGTEYFISLKHLNLDGIKLIKKIKASEDNLPDYYIYKNDQTSEHFYFVSQYVTKETLNQFLQKANEESFSFQNTVILEQSLSEKFYPLKDYKIKISKDTDQKIVLKTETDKKAILVIADSFYPNWQAKINKQKTTIMPANLNQRALIVPAGENVIEMYYYPKEFIWGILTSIISFIIFAII